MAGRTPHWHHQPWLQPLIAGALAAYIKLVHATGRWRVICDPQAAELLRAGTPLIGAFWHGRMMMIAPAWQTLVKELGVSRPLQPYVIGSDHRDATLVAQVSQRFGLRSVRASTKRGGIGLLRAARRVLDEGNIAVITPDGPRGPRLRVKPGIVHVAQRAGAPVVPVTFAASNQRHLGSWDRFALVFPFARGVYAFGAPIPIARDDDPEAAGRLLETRMNALTDEAERALGRAPAEPVG